MGNSRWYDVAPNLRPEAGLLAIRKGLGLFANIRPAYLYKELADACPLKKEIIGDGFDMVIMMVTDVLLEGTQLLFVGDRETIRQAFNVEDVEDVVFLPKIMSRKKQVIPMLSALWG